MSLIFHSELARERKGKSLQVSEKVEEQRLRKDNQILITVITHAAP